MSTTEPVIARAGRSRAPAKPTIAGKPPRRRTQAERSDEMQQRLVEAAATVLRKKGYAGLRTDEVARAAKVSRGALQHHYPSKDSLVVATAEHLLRASLTRGQNRAASAVAAADPIDAIIADGTEFFLGPDFGVVLDLVLAGSKSRGLRDQIYAHARESRLGVEEAWLGLLVEHGVPRAKAEKVLWLTISLIRGLAVRALWQRDEALFKSLLDEWKLIVAEHLRAYTHITPKTKGAPR